ncbi:NinB protein [Modicisalibacter xianhensis]|uniref:NinB protein n=1 Tax=Modicisalibacter xianhensis TaxID=442341 RepID=A0A4R8G679_9GAMM|nr:recombination protein NinB [Halomonas xianhensis]TDX30779.1 NinB protein [Halomonas xianhensis]
MSREWTTTIQAPDGIYAALAQVGDMAHRGLSKGPVEVALRRPDDQRSKDQNDKLHPMIRDIARQCEHCGQKWSEEHWKRLLTALYQQQEVIPGLDGGFVAIPMSTSRMKKKPFSDLVETIYAWGSERGVQWSEPALKVYEQYREAAA